MNMNLEELLKETDALTYINALKVTLTELKSELSTIEELSVYIGNSVEKTRKLQRKADNQYRLISKIINRDAPFATDVEVEANMEDIRDIMEN